MTTFQVICDYCKQPARLVTGKELYPHRPDLFIKYFYVCRPCSAHVGCHNDSASPLGRLANSELRRAKSLAHAAFDPLWKNGRMKRQQAYKWLAAQIGVEKSECHIGMFDVHVCHKVVSVCEVNQGMIKR